MLRVVEVSMVEVSVMEVFVVVVFVVAVKPGLQGNTSDVSPTTSLVKLFFYR